MKRDVYIDRETRWNIYNIFSKDFHIEYDVLIKFSFFIIFLLLNRCFSTFNSIFNINRNCWFRFCYTQINEILFLRYVIKYFRKKRKYWQKQNFYCLIKSNLLPLCFSLFFILLIFFFTTVICRKNKVF